MEISELRYKNIVDTGEGIFGIAELHKDSAVMFNDIAWYYNQWSGVELDEEWLLKFGFIHPFKDLANVRRYLINDGRVELRYLKHNNTVFLSYFNAREIKYVHQLQNLYFALIGEELTIKETTKP